MCVDGVVMHVMQYLQVLYLTVMDRIAYSVRVGVTFLEGCTPFVCLEGCGPFMLEGSLLWLDVNWF